MDTLASEHSNRLSRKGLVASIEVATSRLALRQQALRLKEFILAHHWAILFVLAALSIPPRLVNLDSPLTDQHAFRQTQTALSVWQIRENGLDLLHPKLPLFGHPWECPFEYPVFQIAAAAVDYLSPWTNLDISLRVTNLMFFYATALVLYLLARQWIGPVGAFLGAGAFLYSPFNLFWSRTSMIEYAATFFGLAYLLAFIRWQRSQDWKTLISCLLLGTLGALAKITTFFIPLAIAASLSGLYLFSQKRLGPRAPMSIHSERAEMRGRPPVLRTLGRKLFRPTHQLLQVLLLCIPFLLGLLYIAYGDGIKEQSPSTAWLSSSHPQMKLWTYGTIEQRCNWDAWRVIADRVLDTVTPVMIPAFLAGLVCVPFRLRGLEHFPVGRSVVGCSIAIAPLAAVFVFFNLYWVHTYYFIACAPFWTLCTGLGLDLFLSAMRGLGRRLLFLLVLAVLWSGSLLPAAVRMVHHSRFDARVEFLNRASTLIRKEDPVIIVSNREWDPFPAYYLKRRAFMAMLIDKPFDIRPLIEANYFKTHGFRWMLVEGDSAEVKNLALEISKAWQSAKPMIPDSHYSLYFLSDD